MSAASEGHASESAAKVVRVPCYSQDRVLGTLLLQELSSLPRIKIHPAKVFMQPSWVHLQLPPQCCLLI